MKKIAILGTGINALGFYLGLSSKHKIDIYDFMGDRIVQSEINKTQTILYSNQVGGLSNHWHGVMPAYLFEDREFIALWNMLGKKCPKITNPKEKIFVMRQPVRTKTFFKNIIKLDNYCLKELQKKYDYIFLGLGIFGNAKLLNKNFDLNEIKINDHIVSYKNFQNSYKHSVELFFDGYTRKIIREGESIKIPRTSLGINKTNFKDYLMEKFSYSTSTRNIIKNIFSSRYFIQRVFEAIDNKFGILSKIKKQNFSLIYEQRFCRNAYIIKFKDDKLIFEQNKKFKNDELGSLHYSFSITDELKEELEKKQILLQPSCNYDQYFDDNHSDHQTMKSMLYAYKISRNI